MSGRRRRTKLRGGLSTVIWQSQGRSGRAAVTVGSRHRRINIKQQNLDTLAGKALRAANLGALPVHQCRIIEAIAPDASTTEDDDGYVDIPYGYSLTDQQDDALMPPDDPNPNPSSTYGSYVHAVNGSLTYTANATAFQHEQIARGERLRRQRAAWEPQYDVLVPAFLEYRRAGSMSEPPEPVEGSTAAWYNVDVWTMHVRDRHFPNYLVGETPNHSLVMRGLLSNSPSKPLVAFSFPTLEAYRCLRNRKPNLSIQAFTKALCDIHIESWAPVNARQFSEAYDVYLTILRRVDALVDSTLGHDTPDYRLLHSCPPCNYVLDDEQPLQHSHLLSLDGNSSLKRFATRPAFDPPVFNSDYYLTPAQVDVYGQEVVHRVKKKPAPKGKRKKKAAEPEPEPDPDPEPDPVDVDVEMEIAGDAQEDVVMKAGQIDAATTSASLLDDIVSICVERWKANAAETKKGMFDCFDEAGIFIAICRHGMVLVVCDMVQSGELAKYPLALLDKLQKVFPESKLIGYDIGCAFKKTAAKASFGSSLRAQFVIPSMHGYAHNRACQLGHHPKYISGAGIEDFEGCERVFSASNECARLSRHSTTFHRLQSIDAHFHQWDRDKYANIGTFIRNNYRQALLIIAEFGDILSQLHTLKGSTEKDLLRWFADEETYLTGLTKEPESDTLSIAYVEALEDYRVAEALENEEIARLRRANPSSRRVVPSYRLAQEKVTLAMTRVCELESLLDVGARWSPESDEYKKTVKYIGERKYRLCLDELERLVVQRMFELEKTHLASTGYHVRSQIGTHLTARSKAIGTAAVKYNVAARALTPPRPTVSVAEILKKTYLSEFDLLRESRADIRAKPWADPTTRVLIDQYFRYTRAKEEVLRLNIEMRRMRTWIQDDEANLKAVIERTKLEDTDLAYEISRRLRYHQLVHIRIAKQFKDVEGYIGFNGIKTCGTPRPRPTPSPPTSPTSPILVEPTSPPPTPAPIPPAPIVVVPIIDYDDDSRSDHSLGDADQEVLEGLHGALTGMDR